LGFAPLTQAPVPPREFHPRSGFLSRLKPLLQASRGTNGFRRSPDPQPGTNAPRPCRSGFRRSASLEWFGRLLAFFSLIAGIFLLAAVFGMDPAWAADEPPPVAALLSREIRPYVVAVDALEAALHRPVHRLYLEDGPAAVSAALEDLVRRRALFAAVGPKAVETLFRLSPPPPMVALMVVTPPHAPRPGTPAPPAVILDIPLEEQLRRISALFPQVRAVAVPVPFGASEAPSGTRLETKSLSGVAVHRVVVSNPGTWDRFFAVDAAPADAVLFVPHPMLASTTLIRHVVTQCLLRKKIPVGYNMAFHEAGAAMSFLVDPSGVGRQGARLMEALEAGKTGLVVTAPYRVRLKEKTLQHLELTVPERLESDVEVQP